MTVPRRFPPPWTADETDACFIVGDRNRQALAFIYCEDEPGRRAAPIRSRVRAHDHPPLPSKKGPTPAGAGLVTLFDDSTSPGDPSSIGVVRAARHVDHTNACFHPIAQRWVISPNPQSWPLMRYSWPRLAHQASFLLGRCPQVINARAVTREVFF